MNTSAIKTNDTNKLRTSKIVKRLSRYSEDFQSEINYRLKVYADSGYELDAVEAFTMAVEDAADFIGYSVQTGPQDRRALKRAEARLAEMKIWPFHTEEELIAAQSEVDRLRADLAYTRRVVDGSKRFAAWLEEFASEAARGWHSVPSDPMGSVSEAAEAVTLTETQQRLNAAKAKRAAADAATGTTVTDRVNNKIAADRLATLKKLQAEGEDPYVEARTVDGLPFIVATRVGAGTKIHAGETSITAAGHVSTIGRVNCGAGNLRSRRTAVPNGRINCAACLSNMASHEAAKAEAEATKDDPKAKAKQVKALAVRRLNEAKRGIATMNYRWHNIGGRVEQQSAVFISACAEYVEGQDLHKDDGLTVIGLWRLILGHLAETAEDAKIRKTAAKLYKESDRYIAAGAFEYAPAMLDHAADKRTGPASEKQRAQLRQTAADLRAKAEARHAAKYSTTEPAEAAPTVKPASSTEPAAGHKRDNVIHLDTLQKQAEYMAAKVADETHGAEAEDAASFEAEAAGALNAEPAPAKLTAAQIDVLKAYATHNGKHGRRADVVGRLTDRGLLRRVQYPGKPADLEITAAGLEALIAADIEIEDPNGRAAVLASQALAKDMTASKDAGIALERATSRQNTPPSLPAGLRLGDSVGFVEPWTDEAGNAGESLVIGTVLSMPGSMVGPFDADAVGIRPYWPYSYDSLINVAPADFGRLRLIPRGYYGPSINPIGLSRFKLGDLVVVTRPSTRQHDGEAGIVIGLEPFQVELENGEIVGAGSGRFWLGTLQIPRDYKKADVVRRLQQYHDRLAELDDLIASYDRSLDEACAEDVIMQALEAGRRSLWPNHPDDSPVLRRQEKAAAERRDQLAAGLGIRTNKAQARRIRSVIFRRRRRYMAIVIRAAWEVLSANLTARDFEPDPSTAWRFVIDVDAIGPKPAPRYFETKAAATFAAAIVATQRAGKTAGLSVESVPARLLPDVLTLSEPATLDWLRIAIVGANSASAKTANK